MSTTSSRSTDPRRRVPRTDALLADPRLAVPLGRLGPDRVKAAVRRAQQRCRDGDVDASDVLDLVLADLPVHPTGLRRVLNATGVLVHTNLGRAPWSRAARDAADLATQTTDVELDLTDGRRGARGRSATAALAAAVPDAEAVHVVNNGAAALALVASGLAAGREVVVARGELVEIGDGFRVPELLTAVGARLVEVGATNRVRLADYAAAVGPDTAFVLKVHPSNFVLTGFTSSVPVDALATLEAPVVVDIGSGLLAAHPRLPAEPDAGSALRAGAALVTASADKLLGGPQAGLLLGRADLLAGLRRHPLARALRVDAVTLAALEATVSGPQPPVAVMLSTDASTLHARARSLARRLPGEVEVVASEAAVGGGGAPGVRLPSAALALAAELAPALRAGDPAVLGRLHEGRLLVDLAGLPPDDDDDLVAALSVALRGTPG